MRRIWLILALAAAAPALSGCAVAFGAGAALVADEAVEQERGGDGLF